MRSRARCGAHPDNPNPDSDPNCNLNPEHDHDPNPSPNLNPNPKHNPNPNPNHVLRTARSLLRASQEQQLQDLAGAARRGAVPLLEAPAGARRVSSIISDLSSFVLPEG